MDDQEIRPARDCRVDRDLTDIDRAEHPGQATGVGNLEPVERLGEVGKLAHPEETVQVLGELVTAQWFCHRWHHTYGALWRQ